MRTRTYCAGSLLGLVALLASGCGASPTQSPAASPTTFGSYVALGDGFVTASGAAGSGASCARRVPNYPKLLAEKMAIADVTNVACAGATTAALGRRAKLGGSNRAPQDAAVDRSTDLITVQLGMTDSRLPHWFPTLCRPGSLYKCKITVFEGALEGYIAPLRAKYDHAIVALQRKAPDATVVIVGYPRSVDATSTCAASPAKTARDRKAWARVEAALNSGIASAARDTGAVYVDVYDASAKHALCSDDPWVHGLTGAGGAGPFGPTASGERAIAAQIMTTLHLDQRDDGNAAGASPATN